MRTGVGIRDEVDVPPTRPSSSAPCASRPALSPPNEPSLGESGGASSGRAKHITWAVAEGEQSRGPRARWPAEAVPYLATAPNELWKGLTFDGHPGGGKKWVDPREVEEAVRCILGLTKLEYEVIPCQYIGKLIQEVGDATECSIIFLKNERLD